MKAGITNQRIAASISYISPVASISLITNNPTKGVSDTVPLTDSVTATIYDPYFAENYMVNNNDYACDRTTVTA